MSSKIWTAVHVPPTNVSRVGQVLLGRSSTVTILDFNQSTADLQILQLYEMRQFILIKELLSRFFIFCRPIWGNATVLPFPLFLILFGGTAFPPQNIRGNGVTPRLQTEWNNLSSALKTTHYHTISYSAQIFNILTPICHWILYLSYIKRQEDT